MLVYIDLDKNNVDILDKSSTKERVDIIFRYTAINLQGEKIKGECDEDNIEKLSLKLRKKGYFLLDFKTRYKTFKELFCKKITFQDLSVLCNGLGAMISSGIAISEALNITEELNNKKHIRESLHQIKKSVIKGETIYVSMKKFSNIYPIFMVEMIRIGEESGKLDEVLKKLSEYYEKQNKIFIKLRTAITYPLMVFITSIFIITFLMMKIIPQFIEIITASGGEIPFITKMIIGFYTYLKMNLVTINIILLLIFFLIYSYGKTRNGEFNLDRLKTRIPVFHKFYNKLLMSKFATVTGMLMTSGFTILKSLEIAKNILANKFIESKIINSIEDIKRGEDIYYSFKKQGIGNNLFLSLVKTGEEIGDLNNMLLKAGKIFENDVEDNFKKIVTFIEPVTILFLAFFIGTFVIAALMPVFSIMDAIG